MYTRKRHLFILGVIVLLLGFIVIGTALGSSTMSIREAISAVAGTGDPVHVQIVWKIRLPRVCAAVLAGMALAVSGAAMQSILRNPLGSPFTLGISHAAAFGAAFAIVVLGAGSQHSDTSDAVLLFNPYLVSISAFFWSLFSTGAILLLVRFRGATPEIMILTGIILGSLFTAATTVLQYCADDIQLASIVFWTFGDLGRAVWRDFIILAAVTLPATAYFVRNSWNYNVLNSGDETAQSLGINTNQVRIIGMLIASLTTAVVVSYFGIIAFVGLVVPHIVRILIGGDEWFLIPASALFGGWFLLTSDTVARTILAPVVLPVGILTSFLGAPLFLYLLIKGMQRRYW
ncbi:FecCD family ABC transporter permease [candidate division KSB1 bacterium]